MSMLILVRSADDLGSTVEMVNEFLTYRRRHVSEAREGDEVLGIWARRELELNLPVWLSVDRDLGARVQLEGRSGNGGATRGLDEAAVGIRESFSLSGRWSLCWIDGTLLREAASAKERRTRILDALMTDVEPQEGAFFPVFEAAKTSNAVAGVLKELRARYPNLIAPIWFFDDPQRGIVESSGGQ